MPIFFGFVGIFIPAGAIHRCAIFFLFQYHYPMINCHHCHHHSQPCWPQIAISASAKSPVLEELGKEEGRGGEGEGGEGGGGVHEEMGGDEGGVAVIIGSNKANDPTYMEIGDRGDTIELRENKAYDKIMFWTSFFLISIL